jgi:hypothetical protein
VPTRAKPLRGAHSLGGFIAPFRLSTESRSALLAMDWTEEMLAELDTLVASARFDDGIPKPTLAQIVAALESLEQAAAKLWAELDGLDAWTGSMLDTQILQHLQHGEASPRRFRDSLERDSMKLTILIRSLLRQPRPKTKLGARIKTLNLRVAEIVREIMLKHGRQPLSEGGSLAVATTAVLQELGVLASVTARHTLRRAAKTPR